MSEDAEQQPCDADPNNADRYPAKIDLGVLLCFEEETGNFLWQHSNQKLPTGRVHDWPDQGVCSTPVVDGDRLWYVSNRGEVVCLDTEGFHDGEDDGPILHDGAVLVENADVVWRFDMMKELGVHQADGFQNLPALEDVTESVLSLDSI